MVIGGDFFFWRVTIAFYWEIISQSTSKKASTIESRGFSKQQNSIGEETTNLAIPCVTTLAVWCTKQTCESTKARKLTQMSSTRRSMGEDPWTRLPITWTTCSESLSTITLGREIYEPNSELERGIYEPWNKRNLVFCTYYKYNYQNWKPPNLETFQKWKVLS